MDKGVDLEGLGIFCFHKVFGDVELGFSVRGINDRPFLRVGWRDSCAQTLTLVDPRAGGGGTS